MKKLPRVGINGFGRIGRNIMRNNSLDPKLDIVWVNDVNPDPENIAYTYNYDSIYGRAQRQLRVIDGKLVSDGSPAIELTHDERISGVDWQSRNVDYVIDASGVLQNAILARDLLQTTSVRKVFVTNSPEEVDFTMVLGANEDLLDTSQHNIISTSICDATAIAPVLKLLNNTFGINSGFTTTLHPWLSYQNLMDGPSSSWSVPGQIHHHYALGRSAIGNLIPKPTTAMSATAKVLGGDFAKRIGAFSYRTPTAIVGSADITLNLETPTSTKEVRSLFETFANEQSWAIIANNEEPLVSLDFLKSSFSAIVDHRWTEVIDGTLLKIILWYDNEFGYSCRVKDQVSYVFEKESQCA